MTIRMALPKRVWGIVKHKKKVLPDTEKIGFIIYGLNMFHSLESKTIGIRIAS